MTDEEETPPAPPAPPSVDEPLAHRLALRTLRAEDYEDIKAIMDLVYAELVGSWPRKKFLAMLE